MVSTFHWLLAMLLFKIDVNTDWFNTWRRIVVTKHNGVKLYLKKDSYFCPKSETCAQSQPLLLSIRAHFGIFHSRISTKVLSLLEACFDLISGSSLHMKIQIMGGKITENLGFKSPLRKVKIFFVLFSKMVKNKDMQFLWRILKMKKKKDTKCLTSRP